jgi:hypothetical protein
MGQLYTLMLFRKFSAISDNILDNIRAISMSGKLSQSYGLKSRPLGFGAALPRRASSFACSDRGTLKSRGVVDRRIEYEAIASKIPF